MIRRVQLMAVKLSGALLCPKAIPACAVHAVGHPIAASTQVEHLAPSAVAIGDTRLWSLPNRSLN
jgi:hypothetical protein